MPASNSPTCSRWPAFTAWLREVIAEVLNGTFRPPGRFQRPGWDIPSGSFRIRGCFALRRFHRDHERDKPPVSWMTGGGDVRGLGCRGVGPGAIRIHDVVPHRVSRLLDRTGQLSRGAGGALAVDRTRGLH